MITMCVNLYFVCYIKIQEWKKNDLCEDLKMPSKNEFIATDFSLVPIDKNVI